MKKLIFSCFMAVFSLFLADCKLNKPSEDVDFLVPNEFSVDLFERFDSAGGPSELGLIFRSFKTFPCKKTGLKTRVRWSKDSATVEVLETAKPDDCEAANEPIEQFIGLGPIKNGRFPLTIILGDIVVNRGSLSVSDAEILLEIEDANGIKLNHASLRRVPSEAIWGKISYQNAASEPAATAFLAALDSMTASVDYNLGYYGQFTLLTTFSSQVHLEQPEGLGQSRDFVRQSSRSAADFDGLLQKFRGDAAAALDIQFWTKKGTR